MFCKDRGIADFSVWLRKDTDDMCAQHFWGFPFYHQALFGIFTLPPGTIGIPTLPPAGLEKGRFPTLQPSSKANFYAGLATIIKRYSIVKQITTKTTGDLKRI